VVVRRQLRRRQLLGFFEKLDPCLVGIEACATAHYWAREKSALNRDSQRSASQHQYFLPGAVSRQTPCSAASAWQFDTETNKLRTAYQIR
jgi:hypothetical protein